MKKAFHLSIPQPCHEDWSKMTPVEKGRFCQLCSKTVIDFTQKTDLEINQYLLHNQNQRVCGHFYRKQLDSIVIEIPEQVFFQKLTFSRVFTLALLITMGASLLSCKNDNGKTQKIDNIILLDSIEKDSTILPEPSSKDTLVENDSLKLPPPPPLLKTVGIVCPTTEEKDSTIKITTIEGEIVLGMVREEPPKFIDIEDLNFENAKKKFNDSIGEFIQTHLDTKKLSHISAQKFYLTFDIDTLGGLKNILTTPHDSVFHNEITAILKKFPKMIPAKQRNKPIKVKYTLPIIIEPE